MRKNNQRFIQRYFLLFFINFTLISYAEDKIGKDIQGAITGKVISENGVPLPGVNVLIKGTQVGVSTDFDGNYSIQVPNNSSVLIFSYLGFETQEITVGSKKIINVTLLVESTSLEQIVVIGYGERRKSELIGAVSTVQAETIEEQPVTTFEQALIGQVSGVQFRDNGAPDGGPQLTIRGVSTFGNNNPLYVVDGFPLGTNAGDQRDNYILNSLNPADIESISILKDAASKAIYGSRASNGVVIITTKKGRKNARPVVSFGTFLGIQSVPEFEAPDVLNARELYQYQLEFYEDQEAAGVPLGGLQTQQREFLLGLDDIGPDNDWWDLITRDAIVKNYSLGVSGGGQNNRYNLSIAHQDREGTLINTNFKRYSLNFNFDTDITKNLKLGLNFAPTRSVATGTGTNSDAGNFKIFSAPALAAWTDPTAPLFDNEGVLTGVTQGNLIFRSRNANPVTQLIEREAERRSDLLRLGSFLEWEFLPNLKAKTFWSMQLIDRRNAGFTPSRLPGGNLFANLNGSQQASASVREETALNYIWENTLSYSVLFGKTDQHKLDALIGYTMEKRETTVTTANSSNLVDEEIRVPSASNSVEPADFTGGVSYQANALITYLSRLNYEYDNRYFLTGLIRRDGSSKFGLDNRYGNFWAVGGAWRISAENFWEPVRPVVSEFKIEGGYGISGNNSNIGNYEYQGNVSLQRNDFPTNYLYGDVNAVGAAVRGLPNFNARWEETEETNLGVDLGFFNNRFFIGADYYDIRSVGFLFPLPLPRTSGFGDVRANLGEIQNKGIELEVSATIIDKQDFTWNVNLNYTANRNEVIDVPQEQGFFFPRNSTIGRVNITEVREGEPIGRYRGFNVIGLFTQEEIDDPNVPKYPGAIEGSLKFEDVLTIDTDGDGNPDEADGVLNDQDVTIIGDANPDFIFGFSTRLKYKNFDVNIIADGAIGQQVFTATNQYLANQDDGQFNIERAYLDRWRPGDDPRTRVIPGTGSLQSRQFFRRPNSLHVNDADYLWIRNITLGYRLSGDIFENLFQSTRIYISAQNPFLFTEYEFGSPTVNRAADNAAVRNIDNGAFPVSRTITLGLDVTF
ncbi:SusC/RagA family TonB-linked outer membrane protein [Aquimarina celericrescens]|uniref:SusC/RagA family TonB-linked outer membrane protein n=1 Tax=Aquimarina celericrescens TaxID=1964542 RepID=A0ABW5B045_9FLAO|nr:TonB-dependent receptor [Aquimarina celericrescens]